MHVFVFKESSNRGPCDDFIPDVEYNSLPNFNS